jgi:hypothetical protein
MSVSLISLCGDHKQLQVHFRISKSVCKGLLLLLKGGKAVYVSVRDFFNCSGSSTFVPVLMVSSINIIVWNVEPYMRFQCRYH